MKKLLSLILAGSMLFSLAACTDSSDDKDDDNNKRNKFDAVENIDGDNGGFADGEKDFADEDFNGTQVGDYITFGSYEQDNDLSNGKEPIEWLVLDEKDGKLLVVSKYALDCKQYDASGESFEWESSSLREWLNNAFYIEAFTNTEQIKKMNNSQDKLFLLSIDEANKYFSSNVERECKPTKYTTAKGAHVHDNGNCAWWLCSPGDAQNMVATVYVYGNVDASGYAAGVSFNTVRPAMWIEL